MSGPPPLFARTLLDDQPQGIVGQPADRIDGPLKVSGRAVYAYEQQAEGAAYGFIVGAAVGKGRITAIDTAAAEAAPGVVLVLTHLNVPVQCEPPKGGNRFANPRPVLQGDQVRFRGQPIAFVVAETFEQARHAAALVQAAYAEEPTVSSLESAPSYTPDNVMGRPPNASVGDFAAAFAAAPVTVDAVYRTPVQHHHSIEPHASLAVWEGDRLTLHTSTQSAMNCRTAVAATLQIPPENVRILCKFVGGGFGAKLAIGADSILSALAARMLQRPVKCTFTRQQTFTAAAHRSDTVQRIRLGANADGRLVAVGHDSLVHVTNEDGFIEPASSTTRHLYATPNLMTTHRVARLDLPEPDPMRAPGEAVGMLAIESAMDELAYALDMDPIALRLLNEPERDPESGRPFSSRNLVGCLRDGAARFGWERRPSRPGTWREGRQLIGYGVASALRGNFLGPSKARVRLHPDGAIRVQMSATDIGTGTYTILAQIAAEALGSSIEAVTVEIGDTDLPPAAGSGGSVAASATGTALYDACMNLRAWLAQAAGANDPAQLSMRGGQVILGGQSEPVAAFMRRVAPGGAEAEGQVAMMKEAQAYHQAAYGAFFAEVAVDIDSGEPRLRRMLGVFAAGRILNPKTARSQVIGGMIWGVGSALLEETVIDQRYAAFVNNDLAGYHIAAHADVGEIDAVFLPELDDKANPLRTKGVGELGICGAGAAVANAIYNATGVRVRDYPVTLDKLLPGLPEG